MSNGYGGNGNRRNATIVAGIVALILIIASMIVALAVGGDLDQATPLIASILALVGASIPALIGLAKIEDVKAEQQEVKTELLTEQQEVKKELKAEQQEVKAELKQAVYELNNGGLRDNIKQAIHEYDVESNGGPNGR